ncbi:hypothetical protein BKH41_04120 [Helicobacter sp. 12S02232-10]|uniref:helix-turn-helix domain-containing protein n=1 Tax=Helicobacter sp. 12S02232-10 TaxID=1476197 RepID=UPI000BA7B0FF|nr:helix-turn-helix domain-containing protein [Helicobacter sp. 12S02232-10]PAF48821.1 hypothetical protein BKH41_04120 [Helicobacter sp. 12S02232-10]
MDNNIVIINDKFFDFKIKEFKAFTSSYHVVKIDLLQDEKFSLKDEIINVQKDFITFIGGKSKVNKFNKIKQYGYITKSERQDILNYYKKGCEIADIADLLQKAPTSIKKIIDEKNLTFKDIEIRKQQLENKNK